MNIIATEKIIAARINLLFLGLVSLIAKAFCWRSRISCFRTPIWRAYRQVGRIR
jgi:hypothetical protein